MPRADKAPADAVAEFVNELGVERIDDLRFRGHPADSPWQRLFGGTVIAQASIAAALATPPDRSLHSLHAYFLRGGSHGAPIDYVVDPVRDGRTFSARHISAVQGGETICDMMMSFALPQDGIAHADPMPEVPPPEQVAPHVWEPPPGIDLESLSTWPFEMRPVSPVDQIAAPGENPTEVVWIGLIAPLPDDQLMHTAAILHQTDGDSFGAVVRRHGMFAHRGSASLDHAVWLHRPCRWDDWMLVVTESPVAHSARALSLRRIYTRDGVHVATMAQEGLFRPERSD
jgi:acyl-CoA thioesterase-2